MLGLRCSFALKRIEVGELRSRETEMKVSPLKQAGVQRNVVSLEE